MTDLPAAGVPAIGDPGRAAVELTAGAPPRLPTAPDHVLSEHSVDGLEIRAASVRGVMHRHRGQPRQDAFAVVHDRVGRSTVVVVCDGVGSLPRSGEAAEFVCARLPGLYWTHRNWDDAVKAVNEELRDHVERLHHGLDEDAIPVNAMATTVVAAAVVHGEGGRRVDVVRSDDSTVWWLGGDGSWAEVFVASDVADLHSGSVRALPADAPRLHHASIPFEAGALFVLTDGVSVPLTGSAEVQQTLARWWASPPSVFTFGAQVGFARKTHVDDRTVVGVWLRPEPDGGPPDGA